MDWPQQTGALLVPQKPMGNKLWNASACRLCSSAMTSQKHRWVWGTAKCVLQWRSPTHPGPSSSSSLASVEPTCWERPWGEPCYATCGTQTGSVRHMKAPPCCLWSVTVKCYGKGIGFKLCMCWPYYFSRWKLAFPRLLSLNYINQHLMCLPLVLVWELLHL